MKFSDIETIVGIFQSLATILALVVGGTWSYMLFVSRRQRYPRARVEHKVIARPIANGKALLSVDVFVSNCGEVLLSLVSWEINVKQMLPPRLELQRLLSRKANSAPMTGSQIIEWNLVASRKDKWRVGEFEVEPGEQHQIHSDFLIDANLETILVESFFENVKKSKKHVEWSFSTVHDLTPDGKENAYLNQQ